MARGFAYLTAVLGRAMHKGLSYLVEITLEVVHAVEALEYLRAYESVSQARRQIGDCLMRYNAKASSFASGGSPPPPDEAHFAMLSAIKSAA